MAFQKICEDVVVDTEGALGCILIDLSTGLTLASAQRPGLALDAAEIKAILSSCEALFLGKLVAQFVANLSTRRASASGYVREVQVTRAYTYQFMAALPGWDECVVILITEKTLSLGFAWMAVHQVQDQLALAHRRAADDPAGQKTVSAPAPAAQRLDDIPPQESHAPAAAVAPVSPKTVGAPVPPVWPTPSTATEPEPPAPSLDIAREIAREPAPEPAPEPAERAPDRGVDRKPESEAPAAAASATVTDEREQAPDRGRPVASGPRAKMYRPRPGKTRKDSS